MSDARQLMAENAAHLAMTNEAERCGISAQGAALFALGILYGFKRAAGGSYRGMLLLDHDAPGGCRSLVRECMGIEL